MKKYTPSVKNNNELLASTVSALNAFIYKLEKGKFRGNLDMSSIANAVSSIKTEFTSLQNTIGTGKEDVSKCYERVSLKLEALKLESEQDLTNRFEVAADELCFAIGLWKDVLDGVVVDFESMDEKKVKLSYVRKKCEARLAEMSSMRQEFSQHERRLGADIAQIEKDIVELDEKMLIEENDRIINDYFRRISSSKTKVDMLNIRRSNYSICSQLLDMIESNIKELIVAGEFASEELSKAKALLNLNKLRNVVTEPDKAISILKTMQDDTKKLKDKLSVIDSKVFVKSENESMLSQEAANYKKSLIEKRLQKEQSSKIKTEIDSLVDEEEVASEKMIEVED